MKKLILAEFERLISKKSTWIFLIGVPFLTIASAKYYSQNNNFVSENSPEFTYANSFPIMGLSEQLMFSFNILTLVLVVLTFAQEYHTAQIRLVIQRAYPYRSIVLAKIIIIAIYLFAFMVLYFLFSYLVGFLTFDFKNDILLFFHSETNSGISILLYNLKYYFLAYISLLSMASVYIMLSSLSSSITGAVGLGMSFLIFSLLYPTVLQSLNIPLPYLMFSSITTIQHQGIALMLAESPAILNWNLTVLFLYLFVSMTITISLSSKKDYFI